MVPRPGGLAVGITTLTASIALNAAAVIGLDRAAVTSWHLIAKKAEARERRGPLEFEFVEAPPKAIPAPPKKTKKTAVRDALSQDALPDKAGKTGPPAARTIGPSDQLEQRMGNAQAPVPEIKLTEAQPAGASAQGSHADKLSTDPQAMKVPQAPQAPVPATTEGSDRISTRELAKRKSAGAALFGVTSFEATGSGMGEYLKRMKEKIWFAWYPYIAFQYPRDFQPADALLSFTLDAKGAVKRVEVVSSEGDGLFTTFCVRAIQEASGFGPLPEEIKALIGKEELELKFGFHYR